MISTLNDFDSVYRPKLGLKFFDNIDIQLERPSQNLWINQRVRPEHSVCDCDDTSILTTQSRKSKGRDFPNIHLKMDHSYREHKNVTRVQYFGK